VPNVNQHWEETTMRLPIVCGLVAAAFTTGLLTARLAPSAEAQSAPLSPQIINLTDLTEDAIGPLVPNTDLRSRSLVVTEFGTVSVQSGNVVKHFHADANEVQLILSGAGSFWLGDHEQQVRAGDLIIIPKGTAHAGSHATTGRFRALAIKLPPQQQGDVHLVQ
jgi:mannose-6-phosphate isomerase-like protein (cupin superfamily)